MRLLDRISSRRLETTIGSPSNLSVRQSFANFSDDINPLPFTPGNSPLRGTSQVTRQASSAESIYILTLETWLFYAVRDGKKFMILSRCLRPPLLLRNGRSQSNASVHRLGNISRDSTLLVKLSNDFTLLSNNITLSMNSTLPAKVSRGVTSKIAAYVTRKSITVCYS